MKAKTFCFYLMAVVLAGGVPVLSLHPLYTQENIQFKEELVGIWADDSNDTIWEFKQSEEFERAYDLTFIGGSEDEMAKGLFVAHLVKLKDKFFLDVYPKSLPGGKIEDPNVVPWPYNMFFFVPAHSFLKVEFTGTDTMKVWLTMEDELEKLLDEVPDAVRHEVIEEPDSKIVLTAPTKELQEFVLKYADDERLFPPETTLHRKEGPKPTADTIETEERDEEVKD